MTQSLLILFLAAFYAGLQNALAGGGSFITLPTLMIFGHLDPRAANITSTVALFPAQVVMAWKGRKLAEGTNGLSVRTLVLISLGGGILGAFLLLSTPKEFFARLVPWLVLFATSLFAWGSFFRKPAPAASKPMPAPLLGAIQLGIAIYGGYFGGGIGFLMLATLTAVGMATRAAGATKNVLAMAMNATAVLIFLFSSDVAWLQAAAVGVGATGGGWFGAHLLHKLPEKWIRAFVVTVGTLLTIWLFLR